MTVEELLTRLRQMQANFREAADTMAPTGHPDYDLGRGVALEWAADDLEELLMEYDHD